MILITGGTGYIGKNIAFYFLLRGELVFLIDNFSNSSPSSYNALSALMKSHRIPESNLHIFIMDLSCKKDVSNWLEFNYPLVRRTYNLPPIKAIIHCAGLKSVPESVNNPYEYYRNNINSSLNVIYISKSLSNIPIIFSSSVTVHGNTTSIFNEHTKCDLQTITSPYGKTKFMIEEMLKDESATLKTICLRYFNPIGCYPTLDEEITEKSTNIIPCLVKSIRNKTSFKVYGDDYNTRDGTCIRDYIDVRDLAEAHYKAFKYATENKGSNFEIFNLGTRNGTSVKELLNAFEKVKGIKINYKIVERRSGDSACSMSNSNKAYDVLSWKPTYTLEESVGSINL